MLSPEPVAAESRPLLAAIWMSGAVVSFTAMAVAGRAVAFDLDTFEIMLYRSLLGIAIVVGLARLTGAHLTITRRRLDLHLWRNLSHFTGQNLWFYAITIAPLAQVFALEFTMPIWAMFLAVIVLGERLTVPRLAAAAVGFSGILVITQPWSGPISPGLAFAALAAIGFAGSAVVTRKLTRTETTVCILFWLTVMQAVMGVLCAGIDGDIAWPAAASWPWLVLIGCAGLVAHYCLTTALCYAPATLVAPVDFARLPVVALVGWLLYDEALGPAVFLGSALILGANYANILAETRRGRGRTGARDRAANP